MLDNLEHLPGAEAVVASLLSRAPALTVLGRVAGRSGCRPSIASRSLRWPRRAAVRLFESRARARGFALSAGDGAAVADICRRLDGHPLAIELAAGRLGVLDPAGLAARLGDALSLLGPGPSDAPARQRTLRATLDWSYHLLSAEEREAFTALGAFAGGCSLAAAEEITGASLPVLDTLVDKGLVTAAAGRLSLLEPVRQYAAERLAATTDADAVRAVISRTTAGLSSAPAASCGCAGGPRRSSMSSIANETTCGPL